MTMPKPFEINNLSLDVQVAYYKRLNNLQTELINNYKALLDDTSHALHRCEEYHAIQTNQIKALRQNSKHTTKESLKILTDYEK